MTLSNIKLFKSDNIDSLNQILWETIYNKGSPLHFGSTDEPKDAKEIFAVIQIHGKALKDLYNGKLPKGWKFGEQANKVYVEMLKNPDKGAQPYTYGERLHRQSVSQKVYSFGKNDGICSSSNYTINVNQIEEHRRMLTRAIDTNIQSNRIWGDIGKPTDLKLNDPACFRSWQLRTSERNKVSLRIFMRSSDAGNGYAANLGAFIRVFVDEVITPAGGILEEVIFIAFSEHVYVNDFDMLEMLFGKVPEAIRKGAVA